MRSTWAAPSFTNVQRTLILAVTLGACSLAVAHAPQPLRAPVVLLFLCFVPGLSIVRLFVLDSATAEAMLAIGLSVALTALTATLLLYVHLWSPDAVLFVLAGTTIVAMLPELGVVTRRRETLSALATRDQLLRGMRLLGLRPRSPRPPPFAERPLGRRAERGNPHLPLARPGSELARVEAGGSAFPSWRRLHCDLTLRTIREVQPEAWFVDDLVLGPRKQRHPRGVWLSGLTQATAVPLGWRVLGEAAAGAGLRWRSRLALEALEEICAFGCDPAIVAARAAYGSLSSFRDGLEARGFRYLVRVDPSAAVHELVARHGAAPRRGLSAAASRRLVGDYMRIRHVSLELLEWPELRRGRGKSRIAVRSSRFAVLRGRGRMLICEWPAAEEEPRRFWLSNLPLETPVSQLASLATLPARVDIDRSRPVLPHDEQGRRKGDMSIEADLAFFVAQEFHGLTASEVLAADP